MVGEYNLSSISWPCEPDPSYVPGCKPQDRQEPWGDTGGLMIDDTNPDNVLIGDFLRSV